MGPALSAAAQVLITAGVGFVLSVFFVFTGSAAYSLLGGAEPACLLHAAPE